MGTNYNYYAYDELGSTLYLTDNNGYVTDKYSYDSWGNLTSQTGTTQQPFKYVGKYGYFVHYMDTTVLPYDVLATQSLSASSSRLSFLQTGVRTYFPRLGRYMQVDPIKDGLNWLAYTGDNPVNAIDPKGLKKFVNICVASGSSPWERISYSLFKSHIWITIGREGYDFAGMLNIFPTKLDPRSYMTSTNRFCIPVQVSDCTADCIKRKAESVKDAMGDYRINGNNCFVYIGKLLRACGARVKPNFMPTNLVLKYYASALSDLG